MGLMVICYKTLEIGELNFGMEIGHKVTAKCCKWSNGDALELSYQDRHTLPEKKIVLFLEVMSTCHKHCTSFQNSYKTVIEGVQKHCI